MRAAVRRIYRDHVIINVDVSGRTQSLTMSSLISAGNELLFLITPNKSFQLDATSGALSLAVQFFAKCGKRMIRLAYNAPSRSNKVPLVRRLRMVSAIALSRGAGKT